MKKQALRAPDWFAGGSMYQINPRTFSKEGTIASVTRELPFLASLGFGTMYLCPVFAEDDSTELSNWSERQKKSATGNPKNPYRMTDYFRIDEEYGTDEDLKAFVKESHRLGMRVMLDLVYLHIGPHADILKIHPEFARHNPDGSVRETIWHFPFLNFEHPGLREYLWANMVYYVSVFDVDGYRCDVGDGVPLDFWIEGRRRIQAVKPDAVLLNEGRNYDYLLEGFDACYAFDWHETIYSVFRGEKNAKDIRLSAESAAEARPFGGLLMRDMDNHDTVTDWPMRTELVAGHDGMELAEVLNFTVDGIPMVYTGNELADVANLCMFANRFFPGRFETTDREAKNTPASLRRQEIIQKLNALRKGNEVLSRGETRFIDNDQAESILSFVRALDGERVLFLGNFSKEAVSFSLAEEFPAGERLIESGFETNCGGYSLAPHGYAVIKF